MKNNKNKRIGPTSENKTKKKTNTKGKKIKRTKPTKASSGKESLEAKTKGQKDRKNKDLNSRNGESFSQVDDSKEIINIAYVIIGLFILVIAYYTFFMVSKSEDVINNAYNKRQDLLAEQIVRGSIMSADGKT